MEDKIMDNPLIAQSSYCQSEGRHDQGKDVHKSKAAGFPNAVGQDSIYLNRYEGYDTGDYYR